MTPRSIAQRIPDRVRSERLLTEPDPILTAIASASNPAMQLLFAVWFEFVEPHGVKNLNCGLCLARVLESFKVMRPVLLELERESKILEQL